MPTIKQKVQYVFKEKIGKKFTRKEIIDLVVNTYPGTNRTSVIPSDYCYNRINKDNAKKFDFNYFEWLDYDQYFCLGPNHPYTGTIYWRPQNEIKDRPVGKWKDGAFQLWEEPS